MKNHLWQASISLLLSLPGRAANLPVLTALDINDLFDVDTSCAQYMSGSPSTLQTFANEAANMANYGANMVNLVFEEDLPAAQDYLQGFFKTPSTDTDSLTRILGIYGSVRDFLIGADRGEQGDAISPPGNVQKAALFCDSRSWTYVQLTDTAKQMDGSDLEDIDGNPVQVQDYYRTQLEEWENRQGGKTPSIFLVALPGTTTRNIYVFRQPQTIPLSPCYARDNLKGSTLPARFGGSASNFLPSNEYPIVLLCPQSFSYTMGSSATTLGSVEPRPRVYASDPTQTLRDLVPLSQTFFHELFHSAPFNPTTNQILLIDVKAYLPRLRRTGDGYALNQCMMYGAADAIRNVQNYVWMALGAWYTTNKPASNGDLVTYASGSCIQL